MRCTGEFLDKPYQASPHLAERRGFKPCTASMAPVVAFDPLDAFRHVFPNADLWGLAACFVASGRDIKAWI